MSPDMSAIHVCPPNMSQNCPKWLDFAFLPCRLLGPQTPPSSPILKSTPTSQAKTLRTVTRYHDGCGCRGGAHSSFTLFSRNAVTVIENKECLGMCPPGGRGPVHFWGGAWPSGSKTLRQRPCTLSYCSFSKYFFEKNFSLICYCFFSQSYNVYM